jgi:hypothetical protein
MTRPPHTVLDYLAEWSTRGGVQVGDGLVMPVQPPFGSRVRVNGGKYGGWEFEQSTADTWVYVRCGHLFAESWPALLASARSGGVTVLRVGTDESINPEPTDG